MKKLRSIGEEGKTLYLDPHHARVVRVKAGELIKVMLTDGRFAIAVVTDEINATAEVIEIVQSIETEYKIYVILSLLKKQKVDTAVAFLSQIGVRKIIPVITERTEISPSPEKRNKIKERLSKIAAENARISGVKVPDISDVVYIHHVPKILDEDGVKTRIVFWEKSQNIFDVDVIASTREKSIAILIGPEGGFSHREIELLHSFGFSDYIIGDRIIKSEFFPMYICSAIDFLLNTKMPLRSSQ